MTSKVTFHTLIKGLAGAVIEAQDSIEKHQIENLRTYFTSENRPRYVDIIMPSMQPDAAINDEVMYRAPLLPLVSTNTLKIREVEISFDAELTEIGPPDESASESTEDDNESWGPSPTKRQLAMNAGNGPGVGNVHVKLRVEGAEPTDGAARLMNHLAQSQGVYKSI